MYNGIQKKIIKDINRILVDTTNKSVNAIEEVTKKELNREQCLDLLDSHIASIEYKLDEIKGYRKGY